MANTAKQTAKQSKVTFDLVKELRKRGAAIEEKLTSLSHNLGLLIENDRIVAEVSFRLALTKADKGKLTSDQKKEVKDLLFAKIEAILPRATFVDDKGKEYTSFAELKPKSDKVPECVAGRFELRGEWTKEIHNLTCVKKIKQIDWAKSEKENEIVYKVDADGNVIVDKKIVDAALYPKQRWGCRQVAEAVILALDLD